MYDNRVTKLSAQSMYTVASRTAKPHLTFYYKYKYQWINKCVTFCYETVGWSFAWLSSWLWLFGWFIHYVTDSVNHSFNAWLTGLIIHYLCDWLIRLLFNLCDWLIHSYISSSVHSFIHSSIHPSIHSFIHSFMYLFICFCLSLLKVYSPRQPQRVTSGLERQY